jgi:hypothetical protein
MARLFLRRNNLMMAWLNDCYAGYQPFQNKNGQPEFDNKMAEKLLFFI